MIQLTGKTLLGDGAIWSFLLVGIAVAVCLVRLAMEVRGSRIATTFLALSAGSYLGFLVTHFHPALSALDLARVVASSATLLSGHLCLVYSVALYGRHVYQEAQGTRRAGRTKPVVTEETEPKTPRAASRRQAVVGTKNVRVDAAHEKPAHGKPDHEKPTTEPAPAAVPTITKQSVQKPVNAAAVQDSTDSSREMSKAERRRLRKLDRRERRQGDDSDD
ncbi:MAG: hypothetical protein HYV60_22470 [Planctomycetia bacterium]|nr:hypothetical protein [Planctomycetia bacterium]